MPGLAIPRPSHVKFNCIERMKKFGGEQEREEVADDVVMNLLRLSGFGFGKM